jgi:hypothetical protein
MMITLTETMKAIASHFGSALLLNDDIYTMEIPVGDKGRTQVITGRVIKDFKGRDMLMILTMVGDWKQNLHLTELLEFNLLASYVKIAKLEDKLIVCAEQLMESCEVTEVINMVEECAAFGDYLEEKLFKKDAH